MAWIEVHQALPTHRKTLACAETLNCSPSQVVGLLVTFWLWAVDNTPDGSLAGISDQMIRRAAGWEGAPAKLVTALLDCGFFDKTANGVLTIHDWEDYAGRLLDQRNANRARMKRARIGARSSNSSRSVQETTGSTVPYPTVQNSTLPKKNAKKARWEPPDWFEPMKALPGYKAINHKGACETISSASATAGASPADVVMQFAQRFEGLRSKYKWSDPVAVLTTERPLGIAINQALTNGGPSEKGGEPSGKDWVGWQKLGDEDSDEDSDQPRDS